MDIIGTVLGSIVGIAREFGIQGAIIIVSLGCLLIYTVNLVLKEKKEIKKKDEIIKSKDEETTKLKILNHAFFTNKYTLWISEYNNIPIDCKIKQRVFADYLTTIASGIYNKFNGSMTTASTQDLTSIESLESQQALSKVIGIIDLIVKDTKLLLENKFEKKLTYDLYLRLKNIYTYKMDQQRNFIQYHIWTNIFYVSVTSKLNATIDIYSYLMVLIFEEVSKMNNELNGIFSSIEYEGITCNCKHCVAYREARQSALVEQQKSKQTKTKKKIDGQEIIL